MTDEDPIRLPTVQLLHELPDGSAHVDWMIARDPEGRERLVTFRLEGRVDELSPAVSTRQGDRIRGERIADHRAVYLDYEGPVADAPAPGSTAGGGTASTAGPPSPPSPDRGRVRRLRRGWVVRWDRGEDAWDLSIVWQDDDAPQRIRVHHREGARVLVTTL